MPITVLIGEGALALHCLESLARRHVAPTLVCSFDGSLAESCAQRGLLHVDRRALVREWIDANGCDFLLSVRNPWIVPPEVLAGVRELAINFHDSPLPRYAGLHATSWALLHGEREHGISWHEITPGIDEGRLLAQVEVPISPEDSAFSLNTKCFEAAAGAFDEVLEIIGGKPPTLRPQHGERSYFGADRRPAAQCVIDPTQPADAIVNLVRALDFGHAPNPLGLAKLWVGERPVVVRQAHTLFAPNSATPGSVVRHGDDELRLTTPTGDVMLSGLETLEGATLYPSELDALVESASAASGPSPMDREAITRLDQRVCRRESAWARQLAAGVTAVEHPFVPADTLGSAQGSLRAVALPRLTAALDEALSPDEEGARATRALAVAAAYFARLHPQGEHDLGVVQPEVHGPAAALFHPIVPLRIPSGRERSFETFEAELARTFAKIERRGTIARDLGLRAPALRGRPMLPTRWPVAVLVGQQLPEGLGSSAALVLAIDPESGRVRLWVAPSIGDDATAGLDAQLSALARAAHEDPTRRVDTLPLLDADEHERMVHEWNDTTRPIPHACVHELFEQQARRTPQAPAVCFGDDRLSYAQLDARANQLAHALRARGVGESDRVALAVGRSVQMLVGLLGILKAGAAYVPVDRSLPHERQRLILRRSEPSLLVTDQPAPSGEATIPMLSLSDEAASLASQPERAPAVPHDPEQLAYIIFTSGSTGEPKAVEIRHRSVVNHSLAVQDHYELTPGDRVLASASIGFDVAAEQIYPTLVHGAEVVVRPDDLMESFRGFDAFARAQRLTVMALPTAFWHEWVRYLQAHDLQVPPALRVLGVGTEKVLGEPLGAWLQRRGQQVRFLQGYGPTEATITCTMYRHEGRVDPSRPVPIGRPLANTEIYLLDTAGQPAPVGMPGELCVGGLGLARGYRGRPELTAERFVPHPFSTDPQARLYRTGDLAYYQPDGQIVFSGRSDFQVKIRGFRVELGEIESALRAHPDIEDAVVLLRDDPGEAKRLVAYVVAEPHFDSQGTEARCRAQLPEYMVPAAFVRLDTFAVDGNGKIDRNALPRPAEAPRPAARAARNEVERRIAREFADILGIAQVGPTDGFFALGGDSLRAMMLLDRLEVAFEVPLPLHQFFRVNTVEALAEQIRTADPHAHSLDEPAIIKLKDGEGVPLYMVLGVTMYAELVEALEGDSPVYAIVQPVESEMVRHGTRLPTVNELARRNVELLRQHRPQGPYALGGYSFGGFVAYEMAQQLVAQGQHVPLLALFDCMLPRGRDVGVRDFARGLGRALVHAIGEGRAAPLLARARRHVSRRLGLGPGSDQPEPPAAELSQTEAASLRAIRDGEYGQRIEAYDREIVPYDGTVVLYRALAFRRPTMPGHGFERVVRGQLVTCDVPGDHDSILRAPNVDTMARHLDHLLASPSPEHRCPTP